MECPYTNKDEMLQSKVISFLRFPLIVGVLFIHSKTSLSVVGGISNVDTPIFDLVRDVFSIILPAVAVPLFFVMSGYLFFYNTTFTKESYVDKLKKRIRTLLIPYLFWNGLYLLFNIAVAHAPTLASVFKGTPVSWDYMLSAFWGCREGIRHIYPLAYQFWFIRDLMVMIVLSPLFYAFIKITKAWGVLTIIILWWLDFSIPYIGMRGMGTDAICFFMIGAWLSVNKQNIITETRKAEALTYYAYPMCVIADIFTIHNSFNVYIHNLEILLGIVFYFNLARCIVDNCQLKNIDFWASASFFVFAIHDPWLLTQIRKIVISIFHPVNDISLIFFYFANVVLTALVAVIIYVTIKKICPNFIAVITGGRQKR